jgi:hypothetical protein
MHFTTATLISGFAAIAYAYTQPAGGAPSGNPIIHPGLGELIPAGTTYDITWTPTTPGAFSISQLEFRQSFSLTINLPGNISLLLLRGPSTNVVPIETIVDSVANTGSYAWNVPSTLEPDTTHYGVQLIVEGTGQYQYSPQCGVSNSAVSSSTSGNASTTVTVVPATQSSTWGSSYSNGTWTSAGSANYSAPILTASGSTTASSWATASTSAVLSNTVVPSATATFQATPTASTVVSTGAAVANMARNAGAMMVAGVVGILAL